MKHPILSLSTALLCLIFSTAQPALAEPRSQHSAPGSDKPRWAKQADSEGIWKAAVPPGRMVSEFGGHDPIGLASGAKIQADCSINWVSPDTGKRYCFSSGTSLVYFLNWPKRNVARAAKEWRRLNAAIN